MKGTVSKSIIIIGGGPAGLMAAEVLGTAGHSVTLYERMPTVGRKLLMAGRGGLNLTHSEENASFLSRYGAAADTIAPWLRMFPPAAMRDWAAGLGQETFVGSSGRIFPITMKASPLLRAWLTRLGERNVRIVTRATWEGWDENGAVLITLEDGTTSRAIADAVLLTLGGASWPRLGADGYWVPLLRERDIAVTPLRPANCGFQVLWSDTFQQNFAGCPLKNIALCHAGTRIKGEALITRGGIEGGAIYALSAALRDQILAEGQSLLRIDLRPEVAEAELAKRLNEPRRGQSISTWLRKTLGLSPLGINLLRETTGNILPNNQATLAALIKSVPLTLTAPATIDRAISTAGGIKLCELDEHLMLRRRPGMFAAGEMLDWEAPTGGYLLQACMASGVAAAQGIMRWLDGDDVI